MPRGEQRTETETVNGVRMRYSIDVTWGRVKRTLIESTCQCFGSEMRVHSRVDCPNRIRLVREHARA